MANEWLSTGQGAASGAAAGMQFGPIGSVVGGVIGGALGYDQGQSEQDQENYQLGSGISSNAQLQAQQVQSQNDELAKQKQLEALRTIQLYRKGGIVKHELINIEDGELEVDPATGTILREFDAPKHPKDGSRNPLGDRYVKKGNAIIPRHLAKHYKECSDDEKMEILMGLPDHTENGKAGNGVWEANYGENSGDTVATSQSGGMGVNNSGFDLGSQGAGLGQIGAKMFGAIPAYYLGKQQMQNAKALLDQLSQTQYPKYSTQTAPEMQQSYMTAQRNVQGFTPEERAAYEFDVTRGQNAKLNRAREASGGQGSNAIQQIMNVNNLQSNLGFASKDAELRRGAQRYADTIGEKIANIRRQQENANKEQELRRRMITEENLGKAYALGQEKVAQSKTDWMQGLGYGLGTAGQMGLKAAAL